MARRLLADENGFINLKWVLVIAAVAVAAVMYFPQLSFVITWLRELGSWLGSAAF